ncbi:hypothetical protein ABK040_005484 [Willaertia magna]
MASNKLVDLEIKNFGPVPEVNIQSVLDTLSDEHKNKIKELREKIDTTWNENELLHDHDKKDNGDYFLSDLTLYRFLSGYKWIVAEVEPVLKTACEWRKKYEPWNIHIDEMKEFAQQGSIYHFGFDKAGHPIIYVKLAKDKVDNTLEQNKLTKFRYFVWLYELVIRRMPANVYQTTWIVDMTDASLSVNLVKSMKDMFIELGSYYVERMAHIFVVNTPWSLKFLWGVVKMFLTEQTIEKYNIQGHLKEKELIELLSPKIDLTQLISDYAGKTTYSFDYNSLVEYDNARLGK